MATRIPALSALTLTSSKVVHIATTGRSRRRDIVRLADVAAMEGNHQEASCLADKPISNRRKEHFLRDSNAEES